MRKLIESTLVSLDGIVESPERWALFDEEAVQYSMNELDNYDAFVMGRVTYERLRAIWEPVTGNPYIDAINQMPKHVATRTLGNLGWNATPLGDDVVGAIARLKAQPGRNLIKYGTSRLDAHAAARGSGRRDPALDHAHRDRRRTADLPGHRPRCGQARPHATSIALQMVR